MQNKSIYLWIFMLVGLFLGCGETEKGQTQAIKETKQTAVKGGADSDMVRKKAAPTWAKNASIYEVNVRQFSKEGTFNAFSEQLPRLKEMGIDILWLMPVHPISKTKRKGTLGSYYAVSDYRGINPEFGNEEDFKIMVSKIHSMGMKIIIDWVPNHTGWDHAWIKDHPDWYTKNDKGEITDPFDPRTGKSWGWTDVADLNYDSKEMRLAMIGDLKYWIEEMNIDGFRCDVAENVPDDFWVEASDALHAIKPVFLLAEAEHPFHRNSNSFEASYGWGFHHIMNEIAQGKKNALDIDEYLKKDGERFESGYHMHFTSNHDENSWNGTVFERMGDAHKALAVLAATFDGMPLIYNGMESAMDKRLEFFEKDQIDWKDYPYADFYTRMLRLKKNNKALWNGVHGGKLQKISTGNDKAVFAFLREKEGDKVVVVINLSKTAQEVMLAGDAAFGGDYKELFTGKNVAVAKDMKLKLGPWDYRVFSNK